VLGIENLLTFEHFIDVGHSDPSGDPKLLNDRPHTVVNGAGIAVVELKDFSSLLDDVSIDQLRTNDFSDSSSETMSRHVAPPIVHQRENGTAESEPHHHRPPV